MPRGQTDRSVSLAPVCRSIPGRPKQSGVGKISAAATQQLAGADASYIALFPVSSFAARLIHAVRSLKLQNRAKQKTSPGFNRSRTHYSLSEL